MFITTSQILLSAIILYILWRTYVAYKKKNLSESFVVVWGLFWIGVLILIFQQNFVSSVAHALGISRGVDLVIYISLIVIFFMLYKVLIVINELERQITQVVRKTAIANAKKARPNVKPHTK